MFRKLVAAALFLGATPAVAAWHEASSKHFVVYSDDAPDRVRAFTAKLERYDQAIRAMRGLADPAISPAARVTVFVLGDVDDVARLYGRGGGGIAGFYHARAAGPIAFVPRRGDGDGERSLSPQAILLHEYAHHIMFSTFGDVAFPPWYVEGFAEFNATARFEDDGGVTFGMIPMYRLAGIAGVTPLPAKRLLIADPAHLNDDERESMYGRGWLLTDYLMTDAARREQLGAYIQALNAGKSQAEAATALDAGTLDRRLAAYTREPLKVFMVPGARLTLPPVTVRALGPGEAAVMPARILSKRGVDAKSAVRVLALARRLAAPFPNDAGAQNELAEAEFDAGHPAEAQAAADRAFAADPHSMHALIYEGMSRARILSEAKSTDAAQWSAVRAWFSRANHLDPEYAYPLELYYGSYLQEKRAPTANAEAGLVYAHALAAYDANLALRAAYVLLRQNKGPEAAAVLKPIAYNPHASDEATAAGRLLAAMDRGGAAGARALFDEDGRMHLSDAAAPHATASR